jgi:hypothetical protein
MSENPTIYYPGICRVKDGAVFPIIIKDELSYKVAKLLWDSIAEIYERKPAQIKPVPDPTYEEIAKELEQNVTVITDKKPEKTRVKQPHQSRKDVPNWPKDETTLIQDASSRNGAWSIYKEAFPGKRNANAVKQKWSKLHPKKDGVASTINVKQPAKGISLTNNVKDSIKSIDSSNDVKEPEKEVVDKPFPASPKETRKAASAYQPETVAERFPLKTHVRQVKEYLGRKVTGIGSVTDHVKGLVEVNFNGSQYYKIAPDCLEVV